DATSAVSGTVETVKDAVQETAATVKDTVHDTVESVKEAFDLRCQVDQHPWLMMGISAGAGYLSGCLLGRAGHRREHRAESRQGWLSAERRDWPSGYHVEPARTPEERPSTPRRHWF